MTTHVVSAPFGDYYLASYSVLCERAEIRLRAQSPFPCEPDATEIVFAGVVAYHFEHDNFGTILGHITERPLESFLQEHAARFTNGASKSGWAQFWTGSVPEAHARLIASSVHAFEITSSYGLHGWVLSRSFHTHAANVQVT